MRAHNKFFRFATWIATTGMILGPAAPAVQAQTPQAQTPQMQIPPGADQAQGPEVTPPLRVGRLGWMQGAVSFHTADQDDWSPAVVNYPVTSGDAFWTQPGAEAGIQVSDALVAMSPTTELDVDNLDETSFAATEPQGEIYLRVGTLTQGETYSVQTPRGMVTIAASGRYEIAAGNTQSPTLVTVLEGAAQITGSQTIDVPAGNTAELTGDQAFQSQLVPAMHDEFLNAMLAREQRRPAAVAAAAAPPIVAQMPGGEELSEYGSWSQAPDYGQVWYPQVQAGWQPYREGHWAYVAPWGWTWVDDDPWGFAPFHYGRWVDIGGRWAWVPGADVVAEAPPQPVYAPALVAFFGVGAVLAVGAAFGGSVGWCPLGPGEAWHPWFHASPAYFRNVNIRHVTNFNNVNINNVTINQFRNARAATVVPASAMLTSAQVRPLARSVPAGQLARMRPVIGRVPVQPTTATLGVTPAVARQFHIGAPPAGIAASARPVAPGPAIRRPAGVAAAGQRPVAPALRTPGEVGRVSTGREAAPPATGAIRPAPGVAHETPALRPPGGGLAGPPGAVHEPGRTAAAGPPGGAAPPATGAIRPAPGVARETPALRPPGAGQAGPPAVVHEPGRTAVVGTPGGAGPREARPGAVALPPEARTGLPGRAPEAMQRGPVAGAPATRPAEPIAPGARSAFVPRAAPEVRAPAAAAREAPRSAPAPRPAPEMRAAVPRPPMEARAAPPPPRPAPEMRAAPPPRPPMEARAAPPPPRPAPEARAAAPQQHAEHQEKRPGQP